MAVLAALIVGLAGCETDSFLDSSSVGRFERTPTILPILNQLDIIDEPQADPPGLSEVMPEDLIPEVKEYVMGPGDLVTVVVFELVIENVESTTTRRVDELGKVRLPVIGAVDVAGKTPSELENELAQTLERKGILHDPTVSVYVQETRQNIYTIVGEPRYGGTVFGPYTILNEDFRIMDAIAQARGVPGSVKNIYVYRQVPLYKMPKPVTGVGDAQAAPSPAPTQEATQLIEQLMEGIDENKPPAATEPSEEVPAPEAPEMLDAGLDQSAPDTAWVNVGGKWVRAEQPRPAAGSAAPAPAPAGSAAPAVGGSEEDERSNLLTQRIIRVPYDKLVNGDMRYNVVVRAGDILRIPAPNIGNVYVEGQISRPGAYGLPGDGDLTIKNLLASAGGLSPLAIPERAELIRRIDNNREAWVRINIRAIYNGTQPDVFLKPNDQIIVGTNFFALPLQVIRSGFRTTYGFGFLLDRNFGNDVFGAPPSTTN
ncbi:MAG: polysaccharide biosynthesis/export family protein [Phycisphaeraceae bacterium]|nr:polysaccharide biosynthesis/export family protein [Phycisphaeraceae bacterium]